MLTEYKEDYTHTLYTLDLQTTKGRGKGIEIPDDKFAIFAGGGET